MSLEGCIKCWDSPCTCGYEYKSWNIQYLKYHIAMLQRILEENIRNKAHKLWEQAGCPSGRDLEFWKSAGGN